MARGLTTLPDEMINWVDHGKVVSVMPTDNNEVQELIQGMPNGSLIVATNEEESNDTSIMKHGINVPILTNGLHLYVNPDTGNDSNDGSINYPFRTINHALQYCCRYTPGIYYATIVINLAPGTYNELIISSVGCYKGNLLLQGYGVDNTIINGGLQVYNNLSGNLHLSNITIQSDINNGNNGITLHIDTARVFLQDTVRLINNGDGTTTGAVINVSGCGCIHNTHGLYLDVVLNNSRTFIDCWKLGQVHFAETTINLNGNVYSHTMIVTTNAVAVLDYAYNLRFTGNVTGSRFLVNGGGNIATNGGGLEFIPGTVAGIIDTNTGGIYT